ncbi:MAG: hypothetical protein AAF558_03130 [Verrucomicrobiota bacterium]
MGSATLFLDHVDRFIRSVLIKRHVASYQALFVPKGLSGWRRAWSIHCYIRVPALLTDQEMQKRAEAWFFMPDPFPEWEALPVEE